LRIFSTKLFDKINVTLVESNGFYKFPDTVTTRGLKHIHELVNMRRRGHREVMVYLIQRNDGTIFKPAESINVNYEMALKKGLSWSGWDITISS